ncbi:NACHT domain-containing protein [Enterobacter huaxiensis]|uniref:NACHT domain-containing protein n=1 Tax=Enterobacter huaxiensis TaxID=2494702 RepID=UPI0021759F9E|nr:hypothetical protein [Enterobacter huaxiensis]MCS5452275.1 hypothetical protein [Enterobacter huaxiensis]
MANSYELTQLNSYSFEHMVNFIAMNVLGKGVTGFASGADGGRDGYMKGKAIYPTPNDNWEGIWYIQSKFHALNISGNHQKWLIRQVRDEIKSFTDDRNRRVPDIWIIATNVEPSGTSQTGTYDTIKALVNKFAPNMKFDIWGGRKILDYLSEYPSVAQVYGHFLTPGHILTEMYNLLKKSSINQKTLIEHFMISQFKDLCYTKLEQAGSSDDNKPKIHQLFVDLPIRALDVEDHFYIMESLVSASCNIQKISTWLNFGSNWKTWSKNPRRTRVILLKGGPGQGKSTAGQYFAQIQRAAFILSPEAPIVPPPVRDIAGELKAKAEKDGFWPSNPRIPIFIELKEYANWYITRDNYTARNIITYICEKVNLKSPVVLNVSDFSQVLALSSWFINFDGLDEVPNDLKDEIAQEVITFSNEFLPSIDADALILCTTRPQGYSGQFEELDASVCDLIPLPKEIALACAEPVVRFNRSVEEGDSSLKILDAAMSSPQVKEIMTTPLQSHIMAVVIRDGGRPPEKRWELFNNFYTVMKKREGLKNFPDPKIALLLQEKDLLLKAIHDRLGICLHVRAEYSQGAETSLPKDEFRKLAISTTEMLMDGDTEETVNTLMEATIERLVFVNTPDSTDFVRFDIRQLQEFFAAEFIHNDISDQDLVDRLSVIVADAHWREVVHFILSALIHYKKKTALMLVSTMLYEMDNDNDNHKIKYYNKRAAIGALLVLRLIEEGLLEQDKRTRSLFSKCLTPLWGCLDEDVLLKIASLEMEQSRNWMLSNMIDSYLNMDYGETPACVMLFSVLLDKEHEQFKEVHNKLCNAPNDYWVFLINTAGIHFIHTIGSRIKMWFIKILVDLYFSKHTSIKLLQCIYDYLTRYATFVSNPFESLGIESKYIEYFSYFVVEPHENDIDQTRDTDRYSVVATVSYKNNWHLTKKMQYNSQQFMDLEYSYPIELFKVTCNFYNTKSNVEFRKLLKIITDNNFDINSVPGSLLSMIPLCTTDYVLERQVVHLSRLSDDALQDYIDNPMYNNRNVIPRFRYMIFNADKFHKDKWNLLCDEQPETALNFLTAPYFDRRMIDDAFKEYPEVIIESLTKIAIEHPKLFSPHFFFWKFVFDFSVKNESLIKKLIEEVDYEVSFKGLYNTKLTSIYKLSLPEDKFMIPYLAHSLSTSKSQIDYLRKAHSDDFTNGFLEAFGLSFEELYDIACNENERKLIRASSLSLLLHHQLDDKASTIENFFNKNLDFLITSLYSDEVSSLLTSSVYYLLHDVSTLSFRLKEFLGIYSYLSKDNQLSRLMTHSIYARWRERSDSVVNQSGKLDMWLQA